MLRVEKDLKNNICKDCGNLDYWDWYFCKIEKHKTNKDSIQMDESEEVLECDGFIKRQAHNYAECKDQKCPFWCNDCNIHINKLNK
jgi:hypothetical protein